MSETNQQDGGCDDPYLHLIHLLSAGHSIAESCSRIGLNRRQISPLIRVAETMLRDANLSKGAVDAILNPRKAGCRPKANEAPKYSGPAVTVERAEALDEFNTVVLETNRAQQSLHASLDDIRAWQAGWRPANYRTDPKLIYLANQWGSKMFFHVWPEGFRLDYMFGAVRSLDVEVKRSKGGEKLLCGRMLSKVTEGSSTTYSGIAIAIPLSRENHERWQRFLAENPPKGPPRVRVRVNGDPPAFYFEAIAPKLRNSSAGRT